MVWRVEPHLLNERLLKEESEVFLKNKYLEASRRGNWIRNTYIFSIETQIPPNELRMGSGAVPSLQGSVKVLVTLFVFRFGRVAVRIAK